MALEKKVKQLDDTLSKNGSVEFFLNLCKKYLSPNFVLIIMSHLMCSEKKKWLMIFKRNVNFISLVFLFTYVNNNHWIQMCTNIPNKIVNMKISLQ